MTYVLTSGWASLACELMQLFPLSINMFKKFILRNKEDCSDDLMTFPYHTEVPRVLLFGLIGFTCAIMAPLILPFLLVYFFMAYLVYRNQVTFFFLCFLCSLMLCAGLELEKHILFTCTSKLSKSVLRINCEF